MRLLSETLFAYYAAWASHSEEQLQSLMGGFSQAYEDFSLTISLKKINFMGQEVKQPPVIIVKNHELEVVHQFTYLGSTFTENLSLDAEINRQISQMSTTVARLMKRV